MKGPEINFPDYDEQNGSINTRKREVISYHLNKKNMNIDEFVSKTIITHPLLFNNGFVTKDKKNENYLKHIIEFKSFILAYYLVKKLYDEPEEMDRLFRGCASTLDTDYFLAQYSEPLNIKPSPFIDRRYFEEKLRYYMTDIFEYLKDDFFIPEYCYQSLINSPLSNKLECSDDDFYSKLYEMRIKHTIMILDYSYNNPKEFDNIHFKLELDLDLPDEPDETLYEEREKQLNEQLLEKIINGLCYEINQDFRNYLRNLEI